MKNNKNKSIYQLAREGAGLTRERASEYLNISSETLASYELGRISVNDDIVYAMSELYNHQVLCYQHLKSKATAKYLPNVECKSVSQSVIMLLQSIKEIESKVPDFLRIAYDNKVSVDEQGNWSELMDVVDELQKACLTLKFCKEVQE